MSVITCFTVESASLSIEGKVIFSSGVKKSALTATAATVVIDIVEDDDELLAPKPLDGLNSFLGGMLSNT